MKHRSLKVWTTAVKQSQFSTARPLVFNTLPIIAESPSVILEARSYIKGRTEFCFCVHPRKIQAELNKTTLAWNCALKFEFHFFSPLSAWPLLPLISSSRLDQSQIPVVVTRYPKERRGCRWRPTAANQRRKQV